MLFIANDQRGTYFPGFDSPQVQLNRCIAWKFPAERCE